MARNTLEVLVGTGTLYLAPTGTAFPADPSVAPSGTWLDVGYSEEGWALTAEVTTEDIPVAEEIDPIDILATAREAHLVGIAAQASLENLQTAVGGGTISVLSSPARKKFVPPSSDTIARTALLFRGKAPTVAGVAKVRDIRVPYGIPVGAVELAYRKAPAKANLAMDFRLVKVTGSNLYEVEDLT